MIDRVDGFLNFMTVERGVSPNTQAAYRSDLNQLVDFLESTHFKGESGVGWERVDERVVSAYIVRLHELEYSDTTRARKVASAKSLFSFLMDEGAIAKDPTENLSSPRVGRSLPEALAVEEVDRLLETALSGDTPESKRDYSML